MRIPCVEYTSSCCEAFVAETKARRKQVWHKWRSIRCHDVMVQKPLEILGYILEYSRYCRHWKLKDRVSLFIGTLPDSGIFCNRRRHPSRYNPRLASSRYRLNQLEAVSVSPVGRASEALRIAKQPQLSISEKGEEGILSFISTASLSVTSS